MTDTDQYFDYLRQRSRLGLWYRQAWLYPRLKRQMHGRKLDIGCGIGDMLRSQPGMVGVDINAATVAYCRQQGFDARLMDVNQLPFEDRSFDTIILDNVLEHIVEPAPLLTEVRRVLAPGGTFIIGVPGERGYAADPDHKKFYDAEGLRRTTATSGFVMERLIRMPFPFPGLTRMLRIYCLYGVFRLA